MAGATLVQRRSRFRRGLVLDALLKYAVLTLFAAICLYPLLLIVSAAFRDPRDAGNPFELFSSFRPQNLIDAWSLGNFGRYFLNTVLITVPTVLGVVALSMTAGYALARFNFPGRTAVFYLFILGLMVPFFSMMIPLFYVLRETCVPGTRACMLDTHLAVILPAIAGAGGAGLPLGVFLMRAFFMDMPRDLSDAAKVDGADEWGVFRHVMMPLAAPGAGALAVFSFLSAWNTFLLPLLYMPGERNRTLATGLLLFSGGRTREIELIGAGSLIMIAPVIIFFLFFQRQFIRGVTAGAVRG